MNNRERILSILKGEKPDRIPFMTFLELFPRGEFEREMRERGMGLIANCTSLWSEMPNVEVVEKNIDGQKYTIYHTPVGDASVKWNTHAGRICTDSAIQKEFLIKDVKDYRPVIFMIDDTNYHIDTGAFFSVDNQLGGDGITHCWTDEPPYMDAQYFLGLEKWSYDQFDYPQEFNLLLDALERRQERRFKLLLQCPEKYLINLGNLAGNFGPKQYEKYVIPYYRKYVPLFREQRKILTLHADAINLKQFKNLVLETEVDVIEAFTPPPVGDLSLAEAREAWGADKTIWINFPETVFYEGYEETKKYTIELLKSDPCFNKFIGFTEMGLIGVDDTNSEMFKSGFRAVMDGIDEAGNY